MTIGWHFDNTYSRLSNTFKEEIKRTPVHDPELVILNEELASSLNLDFTDIDNASLQLYYQAMKITLNRTALFASRQIIGARIPLLLAPTEVVELLLGGAVIALLFLLALHSQARHAETGTAVFSREGRRT